jgi:alpha-L-rhamnosidase
MKSVFLSLLLVFASAVSAKNTTGCEYLCTDYKSNPVGTGNATPRLSWEIVSSNKGVMQTAYQIRAAHTEKDLLSNKNLVWDTGKINSDQSIQIQYNGQPLHSAERIYWQVKIWDNKGGASDWSKVAFFETGLFSSSDWEASWIEPDVTEDEKISNPSPMLRKEFELKKEIQSAQIYITTHGLYQLNLNGKKVNDELFNPGWTSYNKRLQYQIFDLTSQLKKGNNAIGIILGDGWYRGFFAWGKNKNNRYGSHLAAIVQLKVMYRDGSEELIVTDNSWKSSTGPILASDIYNGETYDARLEKSGWDEPGFQDNDWENVTVKNFADSILIASEGVPVRINETIKPIAEIKTPKGERVFDMGQNMVGWVQFRLQGKAGDKITLKFAEVLDKEGNFYTENLRAAKATDEYIFKGEGIETYEPHFTFHGFRYVKIENYPGKVTVDNLIGKVIYSDMTFTGNFECSDTLINQLQHNIQWGLRGNFLDVPTDCPQRDERLGWTADAQVFAPTACFNVNAAPFYTKWMKDFIADQRNDGAVPDVVPNLINVSGSTGWGDAATIIPWDIYHIYGDKKILEVQYESMKAWVEYMRTQTASTGFILNTGWHYGDWLAFSTNNSDYPGATTDKDLVATAYFARSTGILQQTAQLLGKEDDANNYAQLLANIKAAFQKEFITSTGRLSSNTQTAYVLALSNNLMPENLKTVAAKRLADDVKKFGHLTTGFLGTPDLCDVLTEYGYPDLAFMLLFQKNYPSWLYPVTKGATTIWERWDGIKTDGSFQDAGMNSFNHYAYGAIGNWLYRQVAGIQNDPEAVGYKKIIIRPHFSEKLTFVKADYHSVYGTISSHWKANGKQVTLDVVIPPNTTAKVYIPADNANGITESGKAISGKSKIQILEKEKGNMVLSIGSGTYRFQYTVLS